MPKVSDIKVFKPDEDQVREAKGWPVWECGVSRFDWDYTQSETCLIIEGEVTVLDRPGDGEVSFGAGDMVVFPHDLSCIWDVKKPVKKYYKFD